MSKKVLIFAGGGVFGIIPAKLMCTSICHNVFEQVDAFGGASVGSQLAAAYASGIRPDEFYNEFVSNVKDVFKPSRWWHVPTVFGSWHKDVKLNENLSRIFPLKLGDVQRRLVIPTFCFKTHRVKVYDNINKFDDFDENVWECCRKSSSAPVYLPIYNWFVDGGLVENIPIMTTLSALSSKANWDWKDIDVLAVGTGWKPVEKELSLNRINNWWTAANWLPHLLEFLTKTNEQASCFWAGELVKSGALKSFTYFNPVRLENSWKMDSSDSATEAANRTDEYVLNFAKVYEEFIKK